MQGRKLSTLFVRVLVLASGALLCWRDRYQLDADGIAYADVARALLRGDWQHGFNSYWSPLYSWLLLPVFALRPSIEWEVPLFHVLNFCGFVFSFAALEWLAHEWMLWRGEPRNPSLLLVARTLVFLWAAVHLDVVAFTSADIFVIAVLLAAAALAVRIERGASGSPWLGIVLGAGFLAKAAFLPAAPLFLVRLRGRHLLQATAPLAAILLAWGSLLSIFSGRIVLNDSGRLNYSWLVSNYGVEGYKDTTLGPPGGIPHPVRVAFDHPRVLSFDPHSVGAMPQHTEPQWWSEGYPVTFDLSRQIAVFGPNLLWTLRRFAVSPAVLLAAMFLVLGYARPLVKQFASAWWLWLPPLVMLVAYCAVFLHDRYVAGPFALLGFVLLAAAWNIELSRRAALAAALLLALWTGYLLRYSAFIPDGAGRDMVDASLWLQRRGFREGDKVGAIGITISQFWLELLRGQEVAAIPARISYEHSGPGQPPLVTMPEPELFWNSDAETQNRVLELFRALGADWVIAYPIPPGANTAGWESPGTVGPYTMLVRRLSSRPVPKAPPGS
jgi:hypothetical protein